VVWSRLDLDMDVFDTTQSRLAYVCSTCASSSVQRGAHPLSREKTCKPFGYRRVTLCGLDWICAVVYKRATRGGQKSMRRGLVGSLGQKTASCMYWHHAHGMLRGVLPRGDCAMHQLLFETEAFEALLVCRRQSQLCIGSARVSHRHPEQFVTLL
jgi:hypothetical protein